jgi:hypothetical protein
MSETNEKAAVLTAHVLPVATRRGAAQAGGQLPGRGGWLAPGGRAGAEVGTGFVGVSGGPA